MMRNSIAADVRFWGTGVFGTAKAVDTMADLNGSFSSAGSWLDPDLVGVLFLEDDYLVLGYDVVV